MLGGQLDQARRVGWQFADGRCAGLIHGSACGDSELVEAGRGVDGEVAGLRAGDGEGVGEPTGQERNRAGTRGPSLASTSTRSSPSSTRNVSSSTV